MLIPLDRKPEWRNPPFMTLLLIVINVLVFMVFQSSDEHREQIALDYYFNSDLTELELPRYQQYLYEDSQPLSEDQQVQLFWEMQADGDFLRLLRNGQIIKPSEAVFTEWKKQRSHFDRLLNNIFSYHYSLRTAEPSLVTLFSHMFLHADYGHLIGNMLFLFLFGFVIELTLGRMFYLGTYLLAGVLSALFDIMLNPGSGLWGLGASGAISGLAGMYTVLFGFRKIRFFYTLLFYFDYIKAPALIMLPAWLLYELYQQLMYPDSQINNLAHIGGLLAGALIAFVVRRYSNRVNLEYLDREEKAEAFRNKYAMAMQKVAQLDFSSAKQLFRELDEEYPGNTEVQIQLFNILKHHPDDPLLHDYASQVLSLDNIKQLPEQQLHEIYQEYISRSARTMLKADQMLALAVRFANGSYIEDAERIIIFLTKRKPDFTRNAEGLMALISRFRKLNKLQKSQQYFSILEKCYPGSKEHQIAERFIRS